MWTEKLFKHTYVYANICINTITNMTEVVMNLQTVWTRIWEDFEEIMEREQCI